MQTFRTTARPQKTTKSSVKGTGNTKPDKDWLHQLFPNGAVGTGSLPGGGSGSGSGSSSGYFTIIQILNQKICQLNYRFRQWFRLYRQAPVLRLLDALGRVQKQPGLDVAQLLCLMQWCR